MHASEQRSWHAAQHALNLEEPNYMKPIAGSLVPVAMSECQVGAVKLVQQLTRNPRSLMLCIACALL